MNDRQYVFGFITGYNGPGIEPIFSKTEYLFLDSREKKIQYILEINYKIFGRTGDYSLKETDVYRVYVALKLASRFDHFDNLDILYEALGDVVPESMEVDPGVDVN